MAVFTFTKARIDKLPLPEGCKAQAVYYDTLIKGLALRVGGGGTKTYFVETRTNGKKCKVAIGKHGAWVPETARKRAQELLVEISQGVDHAAVKAERKAKATTLAEVFELFKQARDLRPETIKGYTGALNRCFPDWLDLPVTDISKMMVEQRYHKLLNTDWQRGTSGTAQAHLGMRALRSILDYAAAKYEDSDGKSILVENPVRRLSQLKIWRPVPARERIIAPTQLKDWYNKGVKELNNDIVRDYLLLCLFTGLRRNEAAKLKWEDVDLDAKTLTIPAENSKNHLEHRLPLSDFLHALLKERSKIQKIGKDGKLNLFVFYGDGVKSGHLVEFQNDLASVTKESKVKFMVHDLRRSFLTYAEMLDVPHYALKKLANHKTTDITARYIQADVERLREPMQRITDFIMQKAGIKLQDIKRKEDTKVLVMSRG